MMVIHLRANVELTEGSVLFGFGKVKLRTGYWKIVVQLNDTVEMKEIHTGEVKHLSYGMLGKLVSTPINIGNLISEDDVPSVVDL